MTGNQNADLTGKWAVCSVGRLGKVEGRKELPWGVSWVGTGIDGEPWASRAPRVLCDNDAAVLETMQSQLAKETPMDKHSVGLYEKFRVERTDGKSAPGEKHSGCRYFVLDLDHDPHAAPALKAYAESCESEYPNLAADLRRIA